MDATVPAPRTSIWTGQKLFLLISLSIGHTMMHCFQQGWYILLPSIKETFGLTNVEYGVIESARGLAGGLINIPSAIAADMLRKRWVTILASGLVGLGLAYLILAVAPSYGFILLAGALVGASTAFWHPPALSTLSARLPERLGLALSIHGMGGNLGNAIGPVMLGVLIGALTWQITAGIFGLPLIAFAVVLWIVLRNMPGRESSGLGGKGYAGAVLDLLKNKPMMGLIIAGGIRGMGTNSVFAFFSLYCQEDLGFDPAKTGLYYFLLMSSGIFSQPLLGYLSDRWGRKAVLVPSVLLLGVLISLITVAGEGVLLMLVAVGIGLFIYSLGAITQAAGMDMTDEKTRAMTIGLIFGASTLFTVPSPTIAGALSIAYGTISVFYYSAALVLVSGIIMAFLPIRSRKAASA